MKHVELFVPIDDATRHLPLVCQRLVGLKTRTLTRRSASSRSMRLRVASRCAPQLDVWKLIHTTRSPGKSRTFPLLFGSPWRTCAAWMSRRWQRLFDDVDGNVREVTSRASSRQSIRRAYVPRPCRPGRCMHSLSRIRGSTTVEQHSYRRLRRTRDFLSKGKIWRVELACFVHFGDLLCIGK